MLQSKWSVNDITEAPVSAQGSQGIAARRTPRRLFRRPVGLLVEGRYAVVQARQLSEGGMSVTFFAAGVTWTDPDTQESQSMTLQDVSVGKRVVMTLILPSGTPVILRGELIYHEDGERSGEANVVNLGIKFDSVPIHLRREIRNYVSSKQAGE
jgi:hypothetical protein